MLGVLYQCAVDTRKLRIQCGGKRNPVLISKSNFPYGLPVNACAIGRIQVLEQKIAILPRNLGVHQRNRRIFDNDRVPLHPSDRDRLVLEDMRHRRQTGQLDAQSGHDRAWSGTYTLPNLSVGSIL